jgi:hypothetical protein
MSSSAAIKYGIIALIAVGVFYYLSDPFKSQVDQKIEQSTKWTP